MQVNQKTSCIWVYLWLLDKMTKIDEKTELGKVWGGKPIKVEQDLKSFGDKKTVYKILSKLEKEGYIKTTRTPYGKSIFITKAKKIFGRRVESGISLERSTQSGISESDNLGILGSESGYSNKTIHLDKTVRQDFVPKSSLKTNKKEMFRNSQSEDADDLPNIDPDTGQIATPKKKAPKDKSAIKVVSLFSDICFEKFKVRPMEVKGSYFLAIKALNELKKVSEVYLMFEDWFRSGKEKQDLVQITQALSPNNINRYKIKHGIQD